MSLKLLVTFTFLVAACSSSSRSGSNNDTSHGGAPSTLLTVSGTTGGNAGAGANPSGEGDSCATPGQTRSCCDSNGMQKCSGAAEFANWGPCLDAKGAAASCTAHGPSGCGVGEFASSCDAGTDSGTRHHCGEGEFGPNCTNPPPSLCDDPMVNTEPEILAGYSPASGQSVGTTGEIKVWINDERPQLIALNEQIDSASGVITTPGDRTGKAPDSYLWEPALYIAPQTAENGGTPHFPQRIKGWYNNMPPFVRNAAMTTAVQVSGMDPVPSGAKLSEKYTTEDIWDVSALGLPPGTYSAEFVIHDGDRDRAIGCVTITITN
jgi:hypothetical protein